MKNKSFMISVSLALIFAGLLGILAFVKGGGFNAAKACNLSEAASCTAFTGGSITGGVIGALQSGGIITGIVALFVVGLGAIILINTMKSRY